MVAYPRLLSSMQQWTEDVRKFVALRLVPVSAHAGLTPASDETLVEILAADQLESARPAWRDLGRRAVEPNPFLEPDFALTAIQHLPQGQRPLVVAVWQAAGGDPRARMIGLWAFGSKNGRIGRSWSFRHGALGAPLVDRLAGARSIDAMLDWLGGRRPQWAAMTLGALVRSGPAFDLLTERCRARGLPWTVVATHARAVLPAEAADGLLLAQARSPKHKRELERLARRLREEGAVEFRSASAPAEVRRAIEQFLAMEHCGWKGKRGTSFLSDAGDAAFLRAGSRQLAQAGKCRVDWIDFEGAPIAMAIVLRSGDRAYFWKTAFDERFARFSPGAQLARLLAQRQLADPSIRLTDSCAIANHPMIDRVWPDRQEMADLLISFDPARASAVVRREKLQRAMRAALKSAANAALRRRAS